MRSPEAKKELGKLLSACFNIFPAYGKDPEAGADIVSGFMLVLADFNIDQIRSAFTTHLGNNKQFPVPADIAHIIQRGNKPPFEAAVFISLQKKEADMRTPAEWEYIRDYERHRVSGRY